MSEMTEDYHPLNLKDNQHLKFPKWYEEGAPETKLDGFWKRLFGKRTRYEDYSIAQLRSIYMDLEGDLRTLIPEYSGISNDEERKNAEEIGRYIVNLLNATKGMLESQKLGKRQMIIASSLLQEIEECIVWITPPSLALAHANDLSSRLAQLDSPNKGTYQEMLSKCKKFLEKFNDNYGGMSRNETENYRARLEEIIRFINTESLRERINTGLQIERLRTLKFWGIALLSLFILVFPYISNNSQWFKFPANIFVHPISVAYVSAISFCVIGGIGGFLSGLLQVRGSKTNLGDYEISVLLFQLRPIFGAFAALVLITIMSWGLLDDLITQREGSYILIAFVSGFSERYFINLLKLNGEESAPDATAKPAEENGQIQQGDGSKPDRAGE
jgi:hypothetical protein